MKKSLIMAVCILVCAVAREAGAFSLGFDLGYPTGGDVNDPGVAFGMQVAGMIDDTFSIEVSGMTFSDTITLPDMDTMDLDVISIGLTGLAGMNVADNVRLYGGAGVEMNQFNGKTTGNVILVDPNTGLALSTHVNLDTAFGYHVCAGTAVNIAESLQLFAQYRYTFTKLSGDMPLEGINANVNVTVSNAIDQDYNFGMAVIGISLLF